MVRVAKEWLLVYIYAGIVVFFSIIPIQESPIKGFPWDKVAHLCIYFIFALIVIRAATLWKKTFSHFLVFISLFLFGLSIEILQCYLSYRSFEVYDIIFNSAGILGAFLGYHAYVR